MICHQYKCIFIHIPKCAGTSIEDAFGHLEGHIGREGQDHRSIRMLEQPWPNIKSFTSVENIIEIGNRLKHQYQRSVNWRNRQGLSKAQYQTYFKFTFVRNPWARTYSWYENVLRDKEHQANLGITSPISFQQFIYRFGGKGMLRPQISWLKDFRGAIPLDFIGRFENLSEDFSKVCLRIGASQLRLPHRLKGKRIDYLSVYDRDTIGFVHKLYKEEIELFEYSFEELIN